MEINKISYNPNFGAKMVLSDERVQKFIKSSFIADSKSTFETFDKYSSIYPDSVVSVGIKNIKGKDYLVVENNSTGMSEKTLIKDSNDSKIQFIDLIKKVIDKKHFWQR